VHGTKRALAETIGIFEIGALKFLAAQGRDLRFVG
jgi:hypothetical protein